MMYLTVELVGTLKAKAEELGVPYNPLADFLLGLALERVGEETLQAWLASRRKGGLSTKERDTLGALQRLTTSETFRFDAGTVADAAGLPRREAYRALKALQGRGVVTGVEGSELDRWGRPMASWWRLAKREGGDQE